MGGSEESDGYPHYFQVTGVVEDGYLDMVGVDIGRVSSEDKSFSGECWIVQDCDNGSWYVTDKGELQ